MNVVVYHIASGQAFFSGAGLVMAALIMKRRSKWVTRLRLLGLFLGLCLVTVSATPFPLPVCAGLFALTVATVIVTWKPVPQPRSIRVLTWGTLAFWGGMAAWEVPYHLVPRAPWWQSGTTLYVIGDSVSAGMESPGEVTWPKRLASRGVAVRDFSRMGATARSAIAQASQIDGPGVVLIEIGGNDLLGPGSGASSQAFEADLDRMLAASVGEGRTLVMLELPLPPFANGYGEVQRRLARRYGAVLIPKRLFLRILLTDDATVDGIHLSDNGQDMFAAMVSRVLGIPD
ncbi:MAG: acyl-CoA thioesterase [Planctomycetaceae bacterium]|nr:acyl-CoA thioesterase [Planctomycetaceae bacterium]